MRKEYASCFLNPVISNHVLMFRILLTSGIIEKSRNDMEESVKLSIESRNIGEKHRAILHIDLENEEKAQIICRTLAVDKEPSRSTAKRTYTVRGHHLVVEIVSLDAKYLQKSIDNLFDMCYLAKQTIEEVTRYDLKMSNNATTSLDRSEKSRVNNPS
ncbi:unnamed protein product [Acanthocheilonema viteae]|uniref:L antigen family member 3 n=1 Tax=Acanthocheilonema viteae TaxID=6277 RepID=A0A498S5Z9_ACAVI|nr:unnamed protein product [Acanthocheilonema viteae]